MIKTGSVRLKGGDQGYQPVQARGTKVNLYGRCAKLDLLVGPRGRVRGLVRPSRLVRAEGWAHLSWSRPRLFPRSVGKWGACDGPGKAG